MLQIDSFKLPGELDDLIRSYFPHITYIGYYVGGGFIRSWYEDNVPKDMDIFLNEDDDIYQVIYDLEKDDYHKKMKSAFALTYTKDGFDIQIITCRIGGIDSILSDFDFTVCQAITDGTQLSMSSEFAPDMMNKRLRLTPAAKERCATTLERCFRYAGYGYKMNRKDMAELVDLIHNANPQQLKFNYAGLKKKRG